jgi:WD40 repeat protein
MSLGLGDRYKVWDINACNLVKDMVDCHFNSDTFFLLFNCKKDLGNYFLSFNHNGYTRLWNFDTGKILSKKQVNNNSSKIASAINTDDNYDKFILLDENCVVYLLEILNNFNSQKISTIKIVNSQSVIGKFLIPWEENSYFIVNNLGTFWEIEKNKDEIVQTSKINVNNVSWAIKFRHHNFKNIVITHSFDQKIRIFI